MRDNGAREQVTQQPMIKEERARKKLTHKQTQNDYSKMAVAPLPTCTVLRH